MSEIKILYISNACPEDRFDAIFTGKKKPSQAAQKYHTLQIEGLEALENDVTALSVLPISSLTYDKRFFREKQDSGVYHFAPILNIPILRNLFMFLYVFFYTVKKTKGREKGAVICDVLNMTLSIAAIMAAALTRTQIVGIVTDVPTKRAFRETNPLKKIRQKLSYFVLGRFDKYIFLTEAMNTLINKKNRPYLVSEGHADRAAAKQESTLAQKHEKKICIYAGSLRKIYGIGYLTQAFVQAAVPDSELHIYGSGDFEEELQQITAQHPNVKYFGIRPNRYIVEEERKATLLINPRPTDEEYTKYSFPSKNLEYMASGTPVLTTVLPGMPKEYHPYVFLIEEETVDALADTLRTVLLRSKEELFAFGQAAKSFVLEQKSNVKQAERIVLLLQK